MADEFTLFSKDMGCFIDSEMVQHYSRPESLFRMGARYYWGHGEHEGSKREYRQAFEYFARTMVQDGSWDFDEQIGVKALEHLQSLYRDRAHVDESLAARIRSFLEQAAAAKARSVSSGYDGDIRIWLGKLYYTGQRVEKDYRKASTYFEGVLVDYRGSSGKEMPFSLRAQYHLDRQMNSQERFIKYVKAKLYLGKIFMEGGRGVDVDYERACSYFVDAATQNDDFIVRDDARLQLGQFYLQRSKHTSPNFRKARFYFAEVSRHGGGDQQAQAYLNLGNIHYSGFGDIYHYGLRAGCRDIRDTINCYKQVVKMDAALMLSCQAHQRLGEIHYLGPELGAGDAGLHMCDYAQAREHFELVVDHQEDAQYRGAALNWLGEIYLRGGYGVEKNLLAARTIFSEIASQQGDNVQLAVLAWLRLGEISSIEKEYGPAQAYFERVVAEQNADPVARDDARRFLAKIYSLNGLRDGEEKKGNGEKKEGPSPSIIAAALGLRKPVVHEAKRVDTEFASSDEIQRMVSEIEGEPGPNVRAMAQVRLGHLLVRGTHECDKGREYLEQVAQQTNCAEARALALSYLGHMYCAGHYHGYFDVKQDYTKALDYFVQAAEQNNSRLAQTLAQCVLGVFYYEGDDVKPDHNVAREYLEQGVQGCDLPGAECARAHLCLGKIYYLGQGVDKNYATAAAYLAQAINWPGVDRKDGWKAGDIREEVLKTLGEIYFHGGYGVEPDLFLARMIFGQLVSQKEDRGTSTFAKLRRGEIYFNEADYERACEYLKVAEESSYNEELTATDKAHAQLLLGQVYSSKRFNNLEKAREYFEKAAGQNENNQAHDAACKLLADPGRDKDPDLDAEFADFGV